MNKLLKSIVAMAAAGLAFTATAATAQTLENIESRGKVIVGIQGDNPPYGFLDSQGRNDGYDAGVATLLGEFINEPVELMIVTNQNRIAALQTGRVDVIFATLSMTAERAKALQYSKPYAEQPFYVLAPADMQVTGIDDLAGKTIGVPRGAIMDLQLTAMAKDSEILRFDDDSSNIQALLSGQVDAIGGSMFYADRLNQQAPGKFENKFSTGSLYIGAGTRLGDIKWNATINSFLDEVTENGKLDELYQKWFKMKLPEMTTPIEGVSWTAE
ncbi:transporter substrate-binding domain-containing protein [Martelella soudanensis]|uniref:transporter substrate-binding domain-containing protein n=1 Tax=unclassified Martelella TaxID=2629616 RepID=UPI0015DF8169|nr:MULTISPECIES: transporter substrate-binding domain-containing protein [unclassified Martelella]